MSNKGIPIVEINNDVKKTIFDIAKLIVGNSCISFYENGVSMDVVSHCIIEGYGISYTSLDKNISIIDYEVSTKKMNMKIMLDIDDKEKICELIN